MLRPVGFGVLLCFVAFHSGVCSPSLATSTTESAYAPGPQPPKSTTLDPNTTTTHAPTTTNATTTTTTPPPTTSTTTAPSTNATTTTPTPKPTTSTSPTTSTTLAPSTTTDNPSSTTAHPPPHPSDRKFDAMSFLGGFALGLGLVAIGILSWKFYLSRQENYYHTL